MPREIKFRAWDTAEKRWYQNAPVIQQLHTDHTWTLYSHLETVALMQFTGLLDKNGKEIYEGDIIEAGVWGAAGYYDETKFIVEFSKGAFRGFRFEYFKKKDRFSFSAPLYKLEEVEVIGNIYEDPEMLEAKK